MANQYTTPRPLADRFWEKVNKNGPVPAHRPELGPCWLFTGTAIGREGFRYGRFWTGETMEAAHRVSYEMEYGPLPEGMHACHHCDTPRCIRPSHLFAGTRSDNQRDSSRKGRLGFQRYPERSPLNQRTAAEAAKTHCKHGHSLADAYINHRGNRQCRTCTKEREARRGHRVRAA